MNLNIITAQDATVLAQKVKATTTAPAQIANQTDRPPAVTKDDLYGRLLKFIPGPLLGVYVFVQNIVVSVKMSHSLRVVLALVVFVLIAALMVVFLRRQKHVRRWSQLAVMFGAFAVFAFSTNGPSQVFHWYKPWFGTVALGLAGAFLIAFNPRPLPPDDINEFGP
ncbi:MAG: hypothetical protein JOZ87_21255 [Chloroflexi bacterium]|nr:hypothetical protein [Chloroflexota bacterium]